MEEVNLKLTLKKQKSKNDLHPVWWLQPIILAPSRLRQENCFEFETSLDYKVSSRSA